MARSLTRAALMVAGGTAAFAVGRALLQRREPYDFRGKVVLITGGSRGLGLVMARVLAQQGARLALGARDPEELERVHEEFQPRGVEHLTLTCDVTRAEQVQEMVRQVVEHFGRIDVLINNAGVIQVAPMEMMTHEDYDEALKVHFWGPLYAIEAVLPHMRKARAGRIVNITSIGGKISVPHLLPYCASKFAQVGFSQGLRAELAKDGIVVTTVCPGLMRTGSPRNAMFKGQHRAEYAWFSISDSLPGLSMDARDAAQQVIEACRYGKAEVVLSLPAKFATTFQALFPGLTADLLGVVNRFLPGPQGTKHERFKGSESESSWSPSWLTKPTEEAAARNNEIS